MYLERLEYLSYFIRGALVNTPPSIAAIIMLRFAVLKHSKLLLGHFTESPCNQVGPFNQKSKSCLKAAKVNPRVSKSAGFSRVGTYLKFTFRLWAFLSSPSITCMSLILLAAKTF